jgi:regulator of sirC expression with transglutaminase-like and TPR domain
VRSRVASTSETALLAHAHAVLFDELGFRGDKTVYEDSSSSYLPVVLTRRTGLPITLSLIYQSVLERLGLVAWGINAPGHFLVSVRLRGKPMLVDPFGNGRVLSQREATDRIAALTGQDTPATAAMLVRASNRDWIRRMLRNLHALFLHRGERDKLGAMLELSKLLG